MSDVLLTVLLVTAFVVVLYFGPRLLGMGRCMDCRKGVAPWEARCWEHSPDNPRRPS